MCAEIFSINVSRRVLQLVHCILSSNIYIYNMSFVGYMCVLNGLFFHTDFYLENLFQYCSREARYTLNSTLFYVACAFPQFPVLPFHIALEDRPFLPTLSRQIDPGR